MIRGSDGALGATVVEKLRQMDGDKLSHQARRRSESILRTRAALDIVEGLEEWQIGFSCTIGTGPEAHHPLWQQFSIHSQGLPSIQEGFACFAALGASCRASCAGFGGKFDRAVWSRH